MAKRKHDRKLNFVKLNPNFGSPLKPKPLIERLADKPVLGKSLNPNLDSMNKNSLKQSQGMIEGMIKGGKADVKVKKLTAPQPTTSTSPQTSSTTTPSPMTSSTTTTPRRTTMPRNNTTSPGNNNNDRRDRTSNSGRGSGNRRGNSRDRRSGRTDWSSDLSVNARQSVYNATSNERGIFYPITVGTPIDYSFPIHNPLHKNINELNIFADSSLSGELLTNYHVNLSNISDRLLQITNGIDTSSNLYVAIFNVFNILSSDVYKEARSSIYTSWTFANFTNYLYCMISASEDMSCIDSVLGYEPKDGVSNKGCVDMRNLFNTATVLNSRTLLRDALIGKCVPPAITELVRWMYQTYRYSPEKGGTHYRWLSKPFWIQTSPQAGFVTEVNNNLTQMNTATNLQISAMFAKLYPTWIIKDIPGAYNDSFHDAHHLEIHLNEPTMFQDAAYTNQYSIYPSPVNATTDVPYYMLTEPDSTNGFGHVMTCFFQGNGVHNQYNTYDDYRTNSGIRHATAGSGSGSTLGSLCNKFYFIGETGFFLPRAYDLQHIICSYDAHRVISNATSTTTNSILPMGAKRVYYNNIQSTKVNLQLFVDYLFSLKAR